MANFRLHKLLLCMGILCFLSMAPSAVATDESEDMEDAGPCAVAGEERDAGGECCIPNLMVEEDGEDKCKELPSDMALAVAVTLIGSFVFLISLQFLMNHPDPDMQESAYRVISSTVSIFSAVLMFQSIDGLIEDQIIEPYEKYMPEHCFEILVDGIHFFVWFTLTQLVIAKVSGALLSERTRVLLLGGYVMTAPVEAGSTRIPVKETSGLAIGMRIVMSNETRTLVRVARGVITTRSPLQFSYEEGTIVEAVVKEHMLLQCECWGMVLAHLAGFASINFWTSFQMIHPFNQSPLSALLVLPMSLIGQLLLQRVSDKCREAYAAGDGKKDFFEDKWDEFCEDAEDDILGLSLSVIVVNALRFSLNRLYGHGCLPNHEQKEEGEACEFEHPLSQALWLLGVGFMFAVSLFITKITIGKYCEEEEKDQEQRDMIERGGLTDEERATKILFGATATGGRMPSVDEVRGSCPFADKHGRSGSKGKEEEEEKEEEEKPIITQVKERAVEVLIVTLSMSFSWCIFHGSRQTLIVLDPSFLGKEENSGTLALALSLIVTYAAFIFIRILDLIADLPDEYTPESVDQAIRQVMAAMSIFIGFAWEQTFDESLDGLAERSRTYSPHAPAFAKLIVGGGCVGVVFIAWKWYILPFVVKQGWKFTYVYSKHDLLLASQQIALNDKSHAKNHTAITRQLTTNAYQELAADDDEAMRLEAMESREVKRRNSALELELKRLLDENLSLRLKLENQMLTPRVAELISS